MSYHVPEYPPRTFPVELFTTIVGDQRLDERSTYPRCPASHLAPYPQHPYHPLAYGSGFQHPQYDKTLYSRNVNIRSILPFLSYLATIPQSQFDPTRVFTSEDVFTLGLSDLVKQQYGVDVSPHEQQQSGDGESSRHPQLYPPKLQVIYDPIVDYTTVDIDLRRYLDGHNQRRFQVTPSSDQSSKEMNTTSSEQTAYLLTRNNYGQRRVASIPLETTTRPVTVAEMIHLHGNAFIHNVFSWPQFPQSSLASSLPRKTHDGDKSSPSSAAKDASCEHGHEIVDAPVILPLDIQKAPSLFRIQHTWNNNNTNSSTRREPRRQYPLYPLRPYSFFDYINVLTDHGHIQMATSLPPFVPKHATQTHTPPSQLNVLGFSLTPMGIEERSRLEACFPLVVPPTTATASHPSSPSTSSPQRMHPQIPPETLFTYTKPIHSHVFRPSQVYTCEPRPFTEFDFQPHAFPLPNTILEKYHQAIGATPPVLPSAMSSTAPGASGTSGADLVADSSSQEWVYSRYIELSEKMDQYLLRTHLAKVGSSDGNGDTCEQQHPSSSPLIETTQGMLESEEEDAFLQYFIDTAMTATPPYQPSNRNHQQTQDESVHRVYRSQIAYMLFVHCLREWEAQTEQVRPISTRVMPRSVDQSQITRVLLAHILRFHSYTLSMAHFAPKRVSGVVVLARGFPGSGKSFSSNNIYHNAKTLREWVIGQYPHCQLVSDLNTDVDTDMNTDKRTASDTHQNGSTYDPHPTKTTTTSHNHEDLHLYRFSSDDCMEMEMMVHQSHLSSAHSTSATSTPSGLPTIFHYLWNTEMSGLTHWIVRAYVFATMLRYHTKHTQAPAKYTSSSRTTPAPSPAYPDLTTLPIIVVDNTHLTRDFILFYIFLAATTGFMVVTLESQTPWATDIATCFEKNAHNLLYARLEEMQTRYEPIDCVGDLYF